jgi:microcystin-dependent protein
MQQKFFVKPFAVAGDRETVPNDIQTTGDVSYEQGYGYDYQRDQAIDPLAKPIERNKHNAILHDITEAVQQYQVFGTPEWITAQDNGGTAYPYARRARVRYRASETASWDVYESRVDNNTTEPSDATKWASVISAIASQEQAVAGTDNSTIMTPLSVAQAISASLHQYKIGEVRMWHGVVEDISAVWGPGWYLCDGSYGTADLRDKFIVGAGRQYEPGDTGGSGTVTLSVENMPVHSHGVIDHGHGHDVNDPSHNHHVNDPGHAHHYERAEHRMPQSGLDTWCFVNNVGATTGTSHTGIWLNGSHTGISIHSANANVAISDAGGGVAHENRPPYYALCFIEYRGI